MNFCLTRLKVFGWFKWFKEVQEEIEDDSYPGRPSKLTVDENIKKIKISIRKDPPPIICTITEIVWN